jgi:uncharacterized protein YggT (Ycf19 family)
MNEETREEKIYRPQEIIAPESGQSEIHIRKIDRMYGPTRVPSQNEEYHRTKTTIRSYNLIWFVVGIVEVLLGFRFIFEILGANQYNGFTQLIYTLSYPFAQPFRSVFGITNIANSYFDWSLLVAAVVYLLIGYGFVQLLRIINPVTSDEVRNRVVV